VCSPLISLHLGMNISGANDNPPIQGKKAMSGKKIEEIKFPMLK
jgi:hypothetical protein